MAVNFLGEGGMGGWGGVPLSQNLFFSPPFNSPALMHRRPGMIKATKRMRIPMWILLCAVSPHANSFIFAIAWI